MAENKINDLNQDIESQTSPDNSKKITLAAACLTATLCAQVQAQDILNNVDAPLVNNNNSALIVGECKPKINTDVITITNNEGQKVAKTLDRDEQPKLTDYKLSNLSIVSNYNFEDKMYLYTEQTTSVSENHPGNFSTASEVANFLVLNHIPLNVENKCGVDDEKQRAKADQDTITINKWEQNIIAFDNMNDRDKELYLRLLNIMFQKAKINHTDWDLPDLMAHTKLEKIITTLSSFATRQLSIPYINEDKELKQLFETSESSVSKYNMNILTELAYMENLLLGEQQWVVDRGDGVLYAIPNMSQEFMVFLVSQDAEGNQFMTTEQINSLLANVYQLNRKVAVVEASEETTQVAQETTEVSESVTDYAQLQETYVSYFKTEKIWKKYEWKLLELPWELQHKLLQLFVIWNQEIWENASKSDKYYLVLRLFKIFEQVNKDSWVAMSKVTKLMGNVPTLKWWKFDKLVTLIAQEADHYEYEMTDEDKAELARLDASIAQSQQQSAQSQINIERFDRLNKLWEKIKLANNN